MFGLQKSKQLVGLDIGSYAIKLIELNPGSKGGKGSYSVEKAGYELLPHDAIVEGTIIDTTAVVDAVKLLFDENKIANKNVVISISGNSVIIKKISLPAMDKEELAESIIWEAKHNIPYPFEETNVDYSILNEGQVKKGQNLDILLVAAKKDKITNYSSVVHQSNKNLKAIEVDVFALLNTMQINYPELIKDKTSAIINMGANITNIIIIEKNIPQLFRDLSLGGLFFTENMRKELNISFDEAEKALKGLEMEGIAKEQLQSVLRTNIDNLLEEIEKTFSFYIAGKREEKRIDNILLSGGLANLTNLREYIEQKFSTKTDLFNPFLRIHYDDKKLNAMYAREMASSFGVATGLATRTLEK